MTLVSEIDPASIPLPDSAGLQSLPTELLERIGLYVDEREWPPYSRHSPRRKRKTPGRRGLLASPLNENQLNMRWVCRSTLYRFMPRLRVEITEYDRLKEWAHGPEYLTPCVR